MPGKSSAMERLSQPSRGKPPSLELSAPPVDSPPAAPVPPLKGPLLTSLCMAHQSGRPCIATVSNNFLFAGKTAVSLILRQQQVHVSQACISPQGHALCHRASDGKNISGCCKGFDSLITMDILGAQDERRRPVTTLSHWTQDGKKGPE